MDTPHRGQVARADVCHRRASAEFVLEKLPTDCLTFTLDPFAVALGPHFKNLVLADRRNLFLCRKLDGSENLTD
jgi:hypothetical protein